MTKEPVKKNIAKSSIILTEKEEIFVQQQLSLYRKSMVEGTDDSTQTTTAFDRTTATATSTTNASLTQQNLALGTMTNTLPTHHNMTLDITESSSSAQQTLTVDTPTTTLTTQHNMTIHTTLVTSTNTLPTNQNATFKATTLATQLDLTSDATTKTDTLPTFHYLTQQNMTLDTTKMLPTQQAMIYAAPMPTTTNNLQTVYYMTDQNMKLDTTTNNLKTFHDLTQQSITTNTLPAFQEIIEEDMTTDTTASTNTLPQDWTDVSMADLTLQAIFGKLEEVNNKVDQIINYLGGAKKKILKQETQMKTTVSEGSVNDIPPHIKQRAFEISSSRGNFAKNLVFLTFTPEERKGRNCTGRSTTGTAMVPLDQTKLNAVKNCVFESYGVPPNLQEKVWREECVKAIDSSCRKERFKEAQRPALKGALSRA